MPTDETDEKMRNSSSSKTMDEIIAGNLKSLRKQLGISQSKLASGIGLTFQQIQKYESGESKIAVSRLYDIARFFGVDPVYFFEDSPGNLNLRNSSNDDQEFADRFELVKTFQAIETKKMRSAVLILVKAISENQPEAISLLDAREKEAEHQGLELNQNEPDLPVMS